MVSEKGYTLKNENIYSNTMIPRSVCAAAFCDFRSGQLVSMHYLHMLSQQKLFFIYDTYLQVQPCSLSIKGQARLSLVEYHKILLTNATAFTGVQNMKLLAQGSSL